MSGLLPEPKVITDMNAQKNKCANFFPFLSRFQRKKYANIEIVLTEKKGYGLRAEEDLPK
jgi:hypothetical protein